MKPVEELNLVTIKAVIADMLEKGLVTSEYYKTIFYKFIALDESPQSDQPASESIEKHFPKSNESFNDFGKRMIEQPASEDELKGEVFEIWENSRSFMQFWENLKKEFTISKKQ